MKLQAIYTVAELAKAAQLTRRRLWYLLKQKDVPVHKLARGTLIYASDLRDRLPLFWESLVAIHDPYGAPQRIPE